MQHAVSAMVPSFGDTALQLMAQELRVEKMPAFFMQKYGRIWSLCAQSRRSKS